MPKTISKLLCRRCGYRWWPRGPRLPLKCASCDDPGWQSKRVRAKRRT